MSAAVVPVDDSTGCHVTSAKPRTMGVGVPRLSYFYGISIYLYFEDHAPPHFHARYGEHQAQVSITTGEVIEGDLPRRAARLVSEWSSEHRAELLTCWDRAIRGEAPGTIEPLA